jgi:hypothetical protein
MTIHSERNTSLSRRCQPYAKSATEKNLRAKASSIKPKTTLICVIHEPLFGLFFISVGNMANSVNGMAKAKAKPNMPTAGATQLPDVTVSTSSRPMMGAVHENDTNTNVKAMRKIDTSPVVFPALVSTLFAQLSGSLISNHPKKLKAKTTSNRKMKILKTALVESELRVLGPNIAVTPMPKAR